MNQTYSNVPRCSPTGGNKHRVGGTNKLLKSLICSYCSHYSYLFGLKRYDIFFTLARAMFSGFREYYYYIYIVRTVGTVGTTQEQQGFPCSLVVPTVPTINMQHHGGTDRLQHGPATSLADYARGR
jgi:hypothetical protein